MLRSNCGGEVEVTEPNAVAGWMRPLSVSGLAAAAVKIQWDSAVVDLGCNVHRVERNARYVRRDGVDHHLILYQIAGQSALTQNDQAVRLAVGDVALVDATRPVTYSSNSRSVQWLSLRLPRKSVVSHLGFELQGGLGRQGTRAGRLLFDLVRDADKDDGSASFRAVEVRLPRAPVTSATVPGRPPCSGRRRRPGRRRPRRRLPTCCDANNALSIKDKETDL